MDNCRSIFLALACFLALSACGGSQSPVVLAHDGQPLPVLYRIDPESLPAMRVRVRDRVNAYRNDAGFAPLRLAFAIMIRLPILQRAFAPRCATRLVLEDLLSPLGDTLPNSHHS